MTTTPFRLVPATPDALREIEDTAPPELKTHFDLIKAGLETIPGVPGEAIYGAVTLRTLALKPDIFRSTFLLEHFAVKHGEIESSTKELLAAVVSWRNEGDETPTCAPYHEAAARFEGAPAELVSVAADWNARKGEVPERVRQLVDFGLLAAFDPRSVTNEHVQEIRALGVSDAGLVELVTAALVAYQLSALNQVFNLVEGQG